MAFTVMKIFTICAYFMLPGANALHARDRKSEALAKKDPSDAAKYKKFNVPHYKLESLPEWIGELENLTQIEASRNRLTSLPTEIGSLKNLLYLDFRDNRLKSLPEELGRLRKLKQLNLYNNRLKSLPVEMGNLEDAMGIGGLDLRKNPLLKYGEGDALGWWDLKRIFSEKVRINQDKVKRYEAKEDGSFVCIPSTKVYKKLDTKSLRWNREALRKTNSSSPIPKCTRDCPAILDVWESKLKQYIIGEDEDPRAEEAARSIANYIENIHNMEGERNKSIMEKAKDLIDAIFMRLEGNPDRLSRSKIRGYLYDIRRTIDMPWYRGVVALELVHSTIFYKNDIEDIFENFIDTRIAIYKNYIFEMTCISGPETPAVLNDVRYKLKYELHINRDHEIRMGVQQERAESALEAFYAKFTPGYIVSRLASEINSNEIRFNEAVEFLKNKSGGSVKYCKHAFEFTNEGSPVPISITEDGVEDILVEMNILFRNKGIRKFFSRSS